VQNRLPYLIPASYSWTLLPEAPVLDASGDIGDVGWEDGDT
jgi:hypothetical protein